MFGSMVMGMEFIGADNNSEGSDLIIRLADKHPAFNATFIHAGREVKPELIEWNCKEQVRLIFKQQIQKVSLQKTIGLILKWN